MATRPAYSTKTNTSVDVLNAIRNSASINYKNYVPVATPDANVIREIGAVIMDSPDLQNEFVSLINRIGRVMTISKLYENPWAVFKKGKLDFGETIEQVFVDIAGVKEFNIDVAEEELFKRVNPNVRTSFFVMNYQKFYKVTIEQEQLRLAFLSMEGVTNLIADIVNSLYTGASYDEFLTMKYMLAKRMINGLLTNVQIPAVTTANMKTIVSKIKGTANKMTFASRNYNLAGVMQHGKKEDFYVIVNADFESEMNVEVLATAFNMDKAEFMGHVILVDGFGELDIARLNDLFKNDPTYTELGSAELQALNSIPAVIVDSDFFMVLDNNIQFTENYNGEGLYWNEFLHTWKTFGVSPFAQCALFNPAQISVTSVTVLPSRLPVDTSAHYDTSYYPAGGYIMHDVYNDEGEQAILSVGKRNAQFEVQVVASDFANQEVTYSLTGAKLEYWQYQVGEEQLPDVKTTIDILDKTTIDDRGLLVFDIPEFKMGATTSIVVGNTSEPCVIEISVKAVSVQDPTKTDTFNLKIYPATYRGM